MIEERVGLLIIQNGVSGKSVTRIKATLQGIGGKKRKEGREVNIDEVNSVEVVAIIVDVQNDDTTSITLSTSSSVNRGNTGIDTISSQSCSVNFNCPFFPCGWSENIG